MRISNGYELGAAVELNCSLRVSVERHDHALQFGWATDLWENLKEAVSADQIKCLKVMRSMKAITPSSITGQTSTGDQGLLQSLSLQLDVCQRIITCVGNTEIIHFSWNRHQKVARVLTCVQI